MMRRGRKTSARVMRVRNPFTVAAIMRIGERLKIDEEAVVQAAAMILEATLTNKVERLAIGKVTRKRAKGRPLSVGELLGGALNAR